MEEKIKILCKTIVNYSLKIKKNEKVLIKTYSEKTYPLISELVKQICEVAAVPQVELNSIIMDASILKNAGKSIIPLYKEKAKFETDNFDCFINVAYNQNTYEIINNELKNQIELELKEYKEVRVNKRKWLILNYPSEFDAYKAKMPYEEYKNYALDTVNVDYKQMEKDLKPLKELMEKTDKVKIIGLGTDLTFSIKNMPAIICAGEYNLPDGEVYTAPIKESVNGKITYNTESPYNGQIYNNVSLTFKDGRIIKAFSNDKNIIKIFEIDEGAKYVGEFSLGLNNKIINQVGDILFDEKIKGSIHFTPGCAYDNCNNGNKSSLHWDLVLIQRKEYGGGEIYFDDVLIRKDGIFQIPELKHLNY